MRTTTKDALLISAFVIFAHNASFFAALSQAANCQNGPDGLIELMWSGFFVILAVVCGIAAIFFHSKIASKVKRTLHKIALAGLCLVIIPGVIEAGLHLYTNLFRPVICAVGRPFISGPSCIDCWCHLDSCGG